MCRAIEGVVTTKDNDVTKKGGPSFGAQIFEQFHTKFPEHVCNAIRIDETCIRNDIHREMSTARGYR